MDGMLQFSKVKAGDTISLDHDVRLKMETVKDADEKEWIFVLFATCATHKCGFLILCTFVISYSITNLDTIKINAQPTFSTAILITTHMLFCTGGSIYTILTTQIWHFNLCSILFYFSGYT